jgi:hypothetical protein
LFQKVPWTTVDAIGNVDGHRIHNPKVRSLKSKLQQFVGSLYMGSQQFKRRLETQAVKRNNLMTQKSDDEVRDSKKATVTLPGTVEKIIPPVSPSDTEKAQIAVEGAEDLYREIRVENTLLDKKGKVVRLKEDAQVEVTIEADSTQTTPKH